MAYTILEDCSPYYVRFTHPDIDKIVAICQAQNIDAVGPEIPATRVGIRPSNFKTVRLDAASSAGIAPCLPWDSTFPNSVYTLFVSDPGLQFPIHKDAAADNFGINYVVQVQDNGSKTHWYDEADITSHITVAYNTDSIVSRTVTTGDYKPTPIKTLAYEPGVAQGVLLNIGMYHSFENTSATNRRIIMITRCPSNSQYDFATAKKMMFGL
jgi:hypothetical protein